MNAGHSFKEVGTNEKTFEIDNFFNYTEADIQHMNVIDFIFTFFPSFFYLLKPNNVSDMSFLFFLEIKTK